MFWTIDFDDFAHNLCQQGVYPLINEVRGVLTSHNSSGPVTNTTNPTVSASSWTSLPTSSWTSTPSPSASPTGPTHG